MRQTVVLLMKSVFNMSVYFRAQAVCGHAVEEMFGGGREVDVRAVRAHRGVHGAARQRRSEQR